MYGSYQYGSAQYGTQGASNQNYLITFGYGVLNLVGKTINLPRNRYLGLLKGTLNLQGINTNFPLNRLFGMATGVLSLVGNTMGIKWKHWTNQQKHPAIFIGITKSTNSTFTNQDKHNSTITNLKKNG